MYKIHEEKAFLLKVFEESGGDLKAVVDYMAKETAAGLF